MVELVREKENSVRKEELPFYLATCLPEKSPARVAVCIFAGYQQLFSRHPKMLHQCAAISPQDIYISRMDRLGPFEQIVFFGGRSGAWQAIPCCSLTAKTSWLIIRMTCCSRRLASCRPGVVDVSPMSGPGQMLCGWADRSPVMLSLILEFVTVDRDRNNEDNTGPDEERCKSHSFPAVWGYASCEGGHQT